MKRRARYPVECRHCGSTHVVIDVSRSKELSHTELRRELERHQRLVCRACGRRWWRLLQVTERY